MKCPECGEEMMKGAVAVRDLRSVFNTSATVSWYAEEEHTKKLKKFVDLKLNAEGYYCEVCNKVIATFEEKEYKFSWIGRSSDEEIDEIEKKICPNCGKEHDIDYPKCPFCKHKY